MPARPRARRLLLATLTSLLGLAVVTGLIEAFEPHVPVLSLGALYLLAIVPVAALFGRTAGVLLAVVCVGAFNFLFLPPLYTFTLADSANWFALAVYLFVAIVVSDLAARARARGRPRPSSASARRPSWHRQRHGSSEAPRRRPRSARCRRSSRRS